MSLTLERVKSSHPTYQAIRNLHYIPNRGVVGQQLHYLIHLDEAPVGIISGASATWSVAARDAFFGITEANRQVALNSIVNNVVFRLEVRQRNLGTMVLALWRRTIASDWEARYGVPVAGFETFVIETPTRRGSMYLADNWTFAGQTKGNAKAHSTAQGIRDKTLRVITTPKLLFVKRVAGVPLCKEYKSTWNKHAGIYRQEKAA